jgi:hypothetical protein
LAFIEKNGRKIIFQNHKCFLRYRAGALGLWFKRCTKVADTLLAGGANNAVSRQRLGGECVGVLAVL